MRNLINAARPSVAVALLLWQAVAFGQSATDLIRTHVEELRVGGRLEVLGEPIASRTVLAHVYENRKFAPAWDSLRHVDDLLKMIDDRRTGAERGSTMCQTSRNPDAPSIRADSNISSGMSMTPA